MSNDDVLKILIASDTHIGYGEKDPIRGDDSFNTFEEIFMLANQEKVRHLALRARVLARQRVVSANTTNQNGAMARTKCSGSRA